MAAAAAVVAAAAAVEFHSASFAVDLVFFTFVSQTQTRPVQGGDSKLSNSKFARGRWQVARDELKGGDAEYEILMPILSF